MPIKIFSVAPDSICALHGILPGDELVSVNGHPINDMLDYGFYTSGTEASLVIRRAEKSCRFDFVKGENEKLGIGFETFLGSKHKGCKNKCVFCFIDQLPKGLRESLYFKDDDERLSYLLGNYISLTNLTDAEAERICEMKLSPVNISVHTTDPELRVRMLKNPHAGEALRYIDMFDAAGIQMNFQLVLCPGLNDGAQLESTLEKLSKYENISSIAAVPVGLTAYREGLPELRPFDAAGAAEVIALMRRYDEKLSKEYGPGVVMASDEFYLLAGVPLPDAEDYGDFCQLENGVGMLALLRSEFYNEYDVGADEKADTSVRRLIVTGEAAYGEIAKMVADFNARYGTSHRVIAAKNNLFGGGVTVTGLLGGADVAAAASKSDGCGELLICRTMLRAEGDLFLDDWTPEKLGEKTGLPVRALENDGAVLFHALMGGKYDG